MEYQPLKLLLNCVMRSDISFACLVIVVSLIYRHLFPCYLIKKTISFNIIIWNIWYLKCSEKCQGSTIGVADVRTYVCFYLCTHDFGILSDCNVQMATINFRWGFNLGSKPIPVTMLGFFLKLVRIKTVYYFHKKVQP